MTAPPQPGPPPPGSPQPGWYPDQHDPRYVRWWDGRAWTQHVRPGNPAAPQPTAPQQPSPPAPPPPGHAHPGSPQPTNAPGTAWAAGQVRQQGPGAGPVAGGGGGLFTEPILVVSQKARIIEVNNEYGIFDQHGQPLGTAVQVGQSGAQKALRAFTKLDSMMTTRLEIRDVTGRPVLHITRPATLWKSSIEVVRGDGMPLGAIRQDNAWGKIRFSLESHGQPLGSLFKRQFFGFDYGITDVHEREIANVTQTFAGLGKELFTTADNYVVRIHQRLPDPLASLVVASALTIDTVVNQYQR